MLFSENLLQFFKLHVKLQEKFGTSPFTHMRNTSSKTKGFHQYALQPSSTNSTKWQKFKIFQFIIFTSMIWFQTLYGQNLRAQLITMECLLYCTASCAFTVTKWVAIEKCTMITESFNLLLQFERRRLQGSPLIPEMALTKYENWMIRLTQIAGFVTSVTLPVGYGLQRWLDNCSPATFAYFVLPHCSFPTVNNGRLNLAPEALVKMTIIFSWTLWLLLDMIGFFCFVVFELSLMPGFCFRYYMKFYQKSLARQYGVERIPGKGAKSQGRLPRKGCISIYREIQILSRYYNLIQQDKIIVGILDIVLLAFIICFYALISNGAGITIPHLFLFSSGLLNGFLGIVVCFGTFGRVYGDSQELQAFLKGKILPRVAPQERTFLSRYFASFPPIKVRLGSVNYVDNMSPIVLLHFCFSQIVNLVML